MSLSPIPPLAADSVSTRMGVELAQPGAPAGGPTPGVVVAPADEVNIHPLDVAGALQILIAEVRASMSVMIQPGAAPPEPLPAPLATPIPVGSLVPAGVAGTAAPPAGSAGTGSATLADVVRAELALLDVAVRAEYTTLAGASTGAAIPSVTSVLVTAATAPMVLVQMMLKSVPEDDMPEPAAWLSVATQAETALRSGMDKAVDAVTAWRNVPLLVVDVARDTRAVVVAALHDDPPNPIWLRPEWLGLAPRAERFWRRRRYARRNLKDPDLYPQLTERPATDPEKREVE